MTDIPSTPSTPAASSTPAAKQQPACHHGNFAFYKATEGGTLYCGGWSRGAKFDKHTVVFDLTGKSVRGFIAPTMGRVKLTFGKFIPTPYYDWVDFEIKDYGLPVGMTPAAWKALYKDIMQILQDKHDVLVACVGGHGRTGMVMSILGYMIFNGKDGWESPVKKLRAVYCKEAVDTEDQENYVYDALGLALEADPNDYKKYTAPIQSWPASGMPINYPKCAIPNCNNRTWDVQQYGLCWNHQKECEKLIDHLANEAHIKSTDIHLEQADGKCLCGKKRKKCHGIVKATCGHIVHDQRDAFGAMCDRCFNLAQAKQKQSSGIQHAAGYPVNGGAGIVWDYNKHKDGD